MSVVSVRVPKDLKERMARIQENWGEYLRRMIERRIKEEEIVEASKEIDRVRSKTKRGVYDAARSVREDRDRA